MEKQRNETGYYKQLAEEIEKDILQGAISVGSDGDISYASSKSPDTTLPLQLSASMTKAIAGIVFYLRHVSEQGDMVFIDEPEVNCHPNVQIMMARVFARMVNAGLRLVISTHSDYIIREINNLIMLNNSSELKKGEMASWGYRNDMSLDYHSVGAYLFAYGNNDKVKVQPIEVTDAGFEVSTIDETISSLNERSQLLFYELRYGKKD